jgi:hypothetical protein
MSLSSETLDFDQSLERVGHHIQSLRDALSPKKPPYCSGTAQIPQDQYTLFYGPKGNAQNVHLFDYIWLLSNLSLSAASICPKLPSLNW